jgi:hypothetical protein
MVLLLKKIQRISTPRNILFMFAITAFLMVIMSLVLQPQILAASGGLPILDVRLHYSYQDAVDLFTALGDNGRALYSLQQAVDTFFPAAFGVTLALVIGYLTGKLFPGRHEYGLPISVPLVGAVFDYAENTLIASQLASFPAVSQLIVEMASYMTSLKWFFDFAAFFVIFLLALVLVYRRMRA